MLERIGLVLAAVALMAVGAPSRADAARANLPSLAQPADDGGAEDADAIVGKWKLADQGLVIQVTKTGAGYAATVVESPKAPALVGKVFLRAVTYDAQAGAYRGELYAPRRDTFVPMSATRKGSALQMTAGKGLFARELTWQKV